MSVILISVGACTSPNDHDNESARTWFDSIEEMVFSDEDFCDNSRAGSTFEVTFDPSESRRKIQALQAAYAVCCIRIGMLSPPRFICLSYCLYSLRKFQLDMVENFGTKCTSASRGVLTEWDQMHGSSNIVLIHPWTIPILILYDDIGKVRTGISAGFVVTDIALWLQ